MPQDCFSIHVTAVFVHHCMFRSLMASKTCTKLNNNIVNTFVTQLLVCRKKCLELETLNVWLTIRIYFYDSKVRKLDN